MPTNFTDEKPQEAEEEKITGAKKTGGLKKVVIVEKSEYAIVNDTAFFLHSEKTGNKTKFPWSQLRHIIPPKACNVIKLNPLKDHTFTTTEGTFTVSLITD